MSLVVVVSSDRVPEALSTCFQSLGYELVVAASARLAVDLCQQRQAELVIVSDRELAESVAAQERRVPVVMCNIDTPPLARDQLLSLWRAGVADLWQWPEDADEVAARTSLLRHRREAVALEAEQVLAQHLADLERDQRAGRFVQMGMLPPNPMAIGRYRFEHRIDPSLILSGDFVDYFSLTDRHYLLYVADVSGHGASSAFVTVLLKNFSRRLRREYRRSMLQHPGEILSWLNAELLEQRIDKHVAVFLAVGDLQEDTLRYVNGGHFPPAVHVSGQGGTALDLPGKPIGLFPEVSYDSGCIDFGPGDRLTICSDGILEVLPGADLAAQEARLRELAITHDSVDALWVAADIDGQTVPDDVTCLMVSREH
ncbi:MAG: PP2C family protein-serine/threonine phosphatase [Pseudomonadota bacterium]